MHAAINNSFSDWSVTTNNHHHTGGRVWILWKPHIFDIQFLQYDAQFIHMYVINKYNHMEFHHTIIYAFNGVGERETLWTKLRNIVRQIQGPWALGGDFNCVLQSNERLGGQVSVVESEPFHDCLQDCEVMDIPATGDTGGRQNRPFKYFDMWGSDPGFRDCVQQVWRQWIPGTKMYQLVRKLKVLKPELKKINRGHISDVENSADIALIRLHQIQKQLAALPGDEGLIRQEYEASQHSILLQNAKMQFLKQKAKAHWIKGGDANSAYFHGVIKARRNKHFIFQIQNHRGHNHTEDEGIQNAFLEYYKMLLGSKASITKVNIPIVQKGRICNEDQKEILLLPVIKEEVKDIIFHIPDDKAPGPDGFSSKFFKDSWDIIVGDGVTQAILDFFDSGHILKQLNATLVTLIPKVDIPTSVLQYMPIACCNVIYKCISKILCSMLSNDLLLFCKGDAPSIMTMLRKFATFSKSSGLQLSKDKYNAYFNGVKKDLRRDIIQISGMVEGKLPFKYLGIPIKTTRLNDNDCKPLIDNMVHKIRNLGAKKLSYAGRLILVQSVLKSLHNYWASMFILPNGVIHRIEAISRNFLWDGGVDYLRTPLV
ncbi:uncharacterized protein LOC141630357 [Silene latifolia]|uniref:uncharacterized protein LOC141630357 n=1 Tax=Silene latifolia TaxID=37657 RepID=UPI003D77D16C